MTRTEDMVLIDIRTCDLTLSQVMAEIARYQREMPGHEVFMDGDLYAIVARARGGGDGMRQDDVLMTLRSGGRMTVPEIVEALAPNVDGCTEDTVRRALRSLRDKGKVRPVYVVRSIGRAVWEVVRWFRALFLK